MSYHIPVMPNEVIEGLKVEPDGVYVDVKIVDGVEYKNYRGMASKNAQLDWRGKVSVSEGVDSWRPVGASLEDCIDDIIAGVRSGLSYSGCDCLSDLFSSSDFVRVSTSSIRENAPHAPGAHIAK